MLIGAIIWAVKAVMDSQSSRNTTINLAGQRIATLLNAPLDAGTYHITWNGQDDAGNLMASGMYMVYLQANTQKASKMITLLK